MKYDWVDKRLAAIFYKYGGFLADHPLPFLILPIIITASLASGLLFITEIGDVEEVYTPQNSPARRTRALVQRLYAEFGGDHVLPRHLTEYKRYALVIVRPTNSDNVLDREILKEVLRLNEFIKNINVKNGSVSLTYSDLCLTWEGECIGQTDIFEVIGFNPDDNATNVQSRPLTYPLATTPRGRTVLLGPQLGIVKVNDSSLEVESAGLIKLEYWLRFDDNSDAIGESWELEFDRQVGQFQSSQIEVFHGSSKLIETELAAAADSVLPFAIVGFVVAFTFAILSTHMLDNVRAKPVLASLGALSAGLALASAFGLLSFIGVPVTPVVAMVSFLVFGVGLDDMFLMISSWRQTDVTNTVKQRTQETFKYAAMSITVTSITDVLALCIGAISNFRSVQIFCLYAGVSVLFDFIYQITFFGACMVLSGYREKNNRHAVTLRKVLPKGQAPSTAYSIFCAGGSDDTSLVSQAQGNRPDSGPPSQHQKEKQHSVMMFFKLYFGPFVTNRIVSYIVVFVYVIYFALAIWGAATLQQGLRIGNLAPDGSKSAQYFDLLYEHFQSFYGFPVSVVVTERVDYSNQRVQQELEDTLHDLESSQFFQDQTSTASWLREYIKYLKFRDLTFGLNYSGRISEAVFVDILRTEFLRIGVYKQFVPDIVFDDDTNTIVSSRFHVITSNTSTTNRDRDMMLLARKTVKKSSLPLKAHHMLFVNYEQYVEVLPSTLQSAGIALSAMFVVALILIPHPICSVVVTASVMSIILGVVGFMSHWSIPLDGITMIAIIISTGFSVDFSAHVTYVFITAPAEVTSRQSSIQALYSVGMPISQAAVSNILVNLPLLFLNSYISRTFFKSMFLVNVIGLIHGLIFIPVFLMITIPSRRAILCGKDK